MSFAHLTLATRDVPRTAAFFHKSLNWPLIERPNNIGRPAAWLQIAAGQELHLVEVADFQPSAFEAEFGRHFAIRVPFSEFAALQQRLREQGAELSDPLRHTPFARFFFRTPEGYVFEVVEADHPPETGSLE